MFVTPIRLDLPLETNQISCCKGKWFVRRFDPDTIENGHIYYNNNNNNNNNIYTGGVLTLSGFRNGPVKNII